MARTLHQRSSGNGPLDVIQVRRFDTTQGSDLIVARILLGELRGLVVCLLGLSVFYKCRDESLFVRLSGFNDEN